MFRYKVLIACVSSYSILAAKLRGKLSPADQSLFDARANYKRIVIMDWNSKYSEATSSNPVKILKDVLWKWDQQVILVHV